MNKTFLKDSSHRELLKLYRDLGRAIHSPERLQWRRALECLEAMISIFSVRSSWTFKKRGA